MEGLVPVLHADQDFDRFLLDRRIDLHRLEPPLERAVLLDVFPVLGRSRRADAANLAARQRRLQDVGGIERAFRRTRPDQRVQLVDEDDDVRVLGQFFHDRLEAFFELAAILGAGDDERDVERQKALVGQEMRHVAVDDLLGEALDDGGLADARLADEHGVVLRAAAEHLLHALDLEVTADQRIELVLHRRLGQVARELGQQRRFLDPRQRRLLVQQGDDVFADGVEAHPLFHEDRRRHGALFPENAEEQVLRADVVVEQPVGLFRRKLQHALGFGAEGDFDRGRDLLAEDGAALDFLADAFEGQMGSGKDAAREPLAFADETEEQMLGFNRDAAQLAGLVAREEEDASRSFRVAFEHPVYLS